ncbi:hypothetical protein [Candidatus Sororendozoicomonas aggregata]|uniref:hypothetical protein n=1 Tax=Candidatus Sororendozoicomonas aggregata TaxID=3073239 RepID=UPI002ED65B53
MKKLMKEFFESLLDSPKAEELCKKGSAEIRQFVRFVEEAGEDEVFEYMTKAIMKKEKISRRQASGIACEDFNALIRLASGDFEFQEGRDAFKKYKAAQRRKSFGLEN